MTEEKRPVYCGSCGSMAYSTDRFCGTCGATIPSDAQPAAPTEDIPTLVQPPPMAAPTRGGGRRSPRWAVPVMLLVVMLASVGALAYAALGPGTGLGASEQNTPEIQAGVPPQENRPEEIPQPPDEEPPTSSAPADTTGDSERERLRTFVYDYHEMVVREEWMITYSMLDETSRQDVSEEDWSEKQEAEGVPAPLESVTIDQNDEVSDSPAIATLYYEDGKEETMTVVVPMAVALEEEAGEPKRILTEEEIADLEEVPTDGGTGDLAAEAEEAAGDYYRASGVADWDYTYDALDTETQGGFTEEEWAKKNQWFFDNGPVVYDIESAEPNDAFEQPTVEVAVRLTGEDGSSFVRTTYLVMENGEWKHRFGQEEIDLFKPDDTYEEFVEARDE